MQLKKLLQACLSGAIASLLSGTASANNAGFVVVPTLDDLGLVALAIVVAAAGAVAIRVRNRK